MKLPIDFKDLLEEFAREKVEHVVIGGYAFAFHVAPRATKDPDILLEGSGGNRERAAQALVRYGASANVVEATRTLSESEVVPIRVIGLDDLIANKRAAAGAQDLADVAKLELVRRSSQS